MTTKLKLIVGAGFASLLLAIGLVIGIAASSYTVQLPKVITLTTDTTRRHYYGTTTTSPGDPIRTCLGQAFINQQNAQGYGRKWVAANDC